MELYFLCAKAPKTSFLGGRSLRPTAPLDHTIPRPNQGFVRTIHFRNQSNIALNLFDLIRSSFAFLGRSWAKRGLLLRFPVFPQQLFATQVALFLFLAHRPLPLEWLPPRLSSCVTPLFFLFPHLSKSISFSPKSTTKRKEQATAKV